MIERTIDSQISIPTFLASLASKGGQNLLEIFYYTCVRPKNNPLKVSNQPIFDEFWGFWPKKMLKFHQIWQNLSSISHNLPSDTKRKQKYGHKIAIKDFDQISQFTIRAPLSFFILQ